MLFMVIEIFRSGPEPVGERFRLRGRMMSNEVTYHASWVDAEGKRCFQIMEVASEAPLREWMANWSDLVEFELIPVMTSSQFWSSFERGPAQ